MNYEGVTSFRSKDGNQFVRDKKILSNQVNLMREEEMKQFESFNKKEQYFHFFKRSIEFLRQKFVDEHSNQPDDIELSKIWKDLFKAISGACVKHSKDEMKISPDLWKEMLISMNINQTKGREKIDSKKNSKKLNLYQTYPSTDYNQDQILKSQYYSVDKFQNINLSDNNIFEQNNYNNFNNNFNNNVNNNVNNNNVNNNNFNNNVNNNVIYNSNEFMNNNMQLPFTNNDNQQKMDDSFLRKQSFRNQLSRSTSSLNESSKRFHTFPLNRSMLQSLSNSSSYSPSQSPSSILCPQFANNLSISSNNQSIETNNQSINNINNINNISITKENVNLETNNQISNEYSMSPKKRKSILNNTNINNDQIIEKVDNPAINELELVDNEQLIDKGLAELDSLGEFDPYNYYNT